jgi:hypothetical protein
MRLAPALEVGLAPWPIGGPGIPLSVGRPAFYMNKPLPAPHAVVCTRNELEVFAQNTGTF